MYGNYMQPSGSFIQDQPVTYKKWTAQQHKRCHCHCYMRHKNLP